MQIECWDARSVRVYKGWELPDEMRGKKIKKKRLKQEQYGEREREQCVSLHKNIVLYNELSIFLFLTAVHSLPDWIFGLEPNLFYLLSKQFFIYLDLVRRYRLHYSKWNWALNFHVLTIIITMSSFFFLDTIITVSSKWTNKGVFFFSK